MNEARFWFINDLLRFARVIFSLHLPPRPGRLSNQYEYSKATSFWEYFAPRPAREPSIRIYLAFPKSQTLKFHCGAPWLALHGANSWLRRAPREIHSTCPPARRGAPDPAPAYFAAVAHAEDVIPQHLHGAGPGGVDECPSEDVRQGRHPGGTHVSGRAQRGVRGRRSAHWEKARRGLARLPATAALAPAPAWFCRRSPWRSPASCKPRPGAGSLPP